MTGFRPAADRPGRGPFANTPPVPAFPFEGEEPRGGGTPVGDQLEVIRRGLDAHALAYANRFGSQCMSRPNPDRRPALTLPSLIHARAPAPHANAADVARGARCRHRVAAGSFTP